MAVVIKSFTVIAPVNAAETALLKVRLLMATVVPVIAPVEPAVRPKLNVPAPSVIPAPNVIAAPVAVPPALVVSTVESAVSVTPPVPKLITSPELLIAAARLTGALPVKFSPPLNRKASAVASPSVTAPVFRKSTFWVKVLPVPVRLTV